MKKLHLPLLMALVIVLASCKKMGPLSPEYFTTTPQVLEAVGGKVPVTINGKFPEKYLKKNAVVEVTPVLRWNGGQAVGQSATFQGEKVQGNDQTISYKAGGNYTMRASFDYVPEMAKSELYLQFKARLGDKAVEIPPVKIADGVISTSELVNQTIGSANPAHSDDAFQRIIKQANQENIMFLIQQANIRASELNKLKGFNKTVAEIDANKKERRIENIEVSAYASPDGGVKLNTGLASNRESNTERALASELKRAKIDANVDTKYTAQDWEGFQELVSKSNIQDKDLILRVLSMYQDPERREAEIKNISSVYKTLADEVLPQLRRSRLTLNYEIIGKSDDEIRSLVNSDPRQLNIEEILYATTLTNDMNQQESIFKKATELFPNDYRAFNNLGELAYRKGDLAGAETYFNRAARLSSNSPEVNMNLGLLALAKGDKAAAETALGRASGAKTLNETLGNLYIAQGQYERAVNSFGSAKTNSAALAQILAKDYNKAKNTLSAISNPDAYTDYLMAIVGARTNNSSMVTSNLRNAIQKDPSIARRAVTDLEFSKFDISSLVR